jgi:zinc protease
MKKIIILFAMVVASLGMTFTSFAQMQPLPNDPAVRKGKLDNGMTYYIRHNEKPAGRCEFYLATNVGAIQETPDQDGLAHFLEHMCFNGTKNFPGKTLLDYLQGIGASFGGNINASTGVEQTQYMLNNIPIAREGVIDTCLLIMHDYSHYVTNSPEEIDKERGVIIEERRTRRNASWRMHEKSLPYLYGNSKYGSCTLIGSEDNLKTFKPQSLANFYHTWYRPDMQALIVVGDVNVDQIEAKIKKTFSDIPAAVNPTPKAVIKVPDNKEPIIGILTDPEASSESMTVLWKRAADPEEMNGTVQGELSSVVKDLISRVMSERFTDLEAKPSTPFTSASLGIGNLCETMEVSYGTVDSKQGKAIDAFKTFYTEMEKMSRFGFTNDEIERAKKDLISSYESRAKKAPTRENSEFVPDLINNFFDSYAYMEPDKELELVKQICGMLNADVLKQVVPQVVSDTNMVIIYEGPEKAGVTPPTKEDFLNAIKEVKASDIKPNVEQSSNEPLLDVTKLKGSAIKKTQETAYGATEWTLKNGVKVIAMKSDKEKDRIRINLFKNGGRSLISDEDMPSFESNIYQLFKRNSGVSKFPKTQLDKMLAGKNVTMSPYINGLHHGISGISNVKDLETAFQLLYLEFTDPRFDENEYAQGINQLKTVLPNLESQPDYKFQKELFKALYGNSPRTLMIDNSVIEKANLQTIEKNYKNMFKDAAGATVLVVGDFGVDTLKTLVEKYVGSLPKGKKASNWTDRHDGIVSGKIEDCFTVDMQTPKTTVYQVYNTPYQYSVKNEVVAEAISYILDMIYTDTLREDEGGTYGAQTSMELSKEPREEITLFVAFETNPSSSDKLRSLAISGMKKLAEEGPTTEQFNRTIENFKKNIPEKRISNDYWMSQLYQYCTTGIKVDPEYEAAVNSLKPEDIKTMLSKIIASNDFIEVVMSPAKAAEKE